VELESTRLLCAWLKNGATGVNALLPSQPLSPPDLAAGLNLAAVDNSPDGRPLYLVNDILNDYEDEHVSREWMPLNNRTLVVMCNGAVVVPFGSGVRPAPQWEAETLELGVAYCLRDEVGPLDRRVMYYTLRAVRDSLNRLANLNGPAAQTARAENGVELLRLRRMQYERMAGKLGRAALLGVVRCIWHVRDTRP
jgi:hypothetical protein